MTTPAVDPLTEYDTAQRRLDQATAKCEGLRETVAKGAELLRDWQTASVSNVNIPLPAAAAMSRRGSIDAHRWPTAQQIAETLAEYHAADHALDNAIRRLPKSMQDRLAK